MPSMLQNLQTRQQQNLSPNLQQGVRLLQLSSLDYAQEIQRLTESNPFLELEEQQLESSEADNDNDDSIEEDYVLNESSEIEFENEAIAVDQSFNEYPRASRLDIAGMDLHAAEISLNAHLYQQLQTLPLTKRELILGYAIIASLDDDGYLRQTVDELLNIPDLPTQTKQEELLLAIKRVQSLDPVGVAARDLQECLMLQTSALTCPEIQSNARKLIAEHLSDIPHKSTRKLAQLISCSEQECQQALFAIKQLNPCPARRYIQQHIQYIVPDVIARKNKKEWVVSLNHHLMPSIRLNQGYVDIFTQNRHHKGGMPNEMNGYLQQAKWAVKNFEQRMNTILEVARCIVNKQKRFFDYGPLAMRSLTLREVAEELGMHESTVSRVTNNKFISTPMGVFELKYFFNRTLSTTSGGTCSSKAIQSLIQEMIANEDPAHPLSDAEIANQLKQQGLIAARRTVTKYRQALQIAPVGTRHKIACINGG